MVKHVALSFLAACVIAIPAAMLMPRPAFADDELITACDGGVGTCVLDTQKNGAFTMTVRCEGDPARYRMSGDAGVTIGAHDLKLDADRTFDIPVGRTKRYVGFALDDGGVANCAIYKPSPQN